MKLSLCSAPCYAVNNRVEYCYSALLPDCICSEAGCYCMSMIIYVLYVNMYTGIAYTVLCKPLNLNALSITKTAPIYLVSSLVVAFDINIV